jgi:hypothetical protein
MAPALIWNHCGIPQAENRRNQVLRLIMGTSEALKTKDNGGRILGVTSKPDTGKHCQTIVETPAKLTQISCPLSMASLGP